MKIRFKNQAGDTIIEVLISMAILALVIGATYASSTRSLRGGTDAADRQQAIALADQQVELIKNADSNNPAALNAYQRSPGTAFCIDNAQAATAPDYGYHLATDSACKLVNGIYNLSVTYDDTTGTFSVLPTWQGGHATPSQLTVYYRVPVPPPVTVNLTADSYVIAYGSSTTVRWSSSLAVRCTLSFTGSQATSGNKLVSPTTNTTYTATCYDAAGKSASKSITITVSPPFTLTTCDAYNVTRSSAGISGRISIGPAGNPTYYYFLYTPSSRSDWEWTSPTFTATSPTAPSGCHLSPSTNNARYTIPAANLTPNTTYNYTLCGKYLSYATCNGGIESFKTGS